MATGQPETGLPEAGLAGTVVAAAEREPAQPDAPPSTAPADTIADPMSVPAAAETEAVVPQSGLAPVRAIDDAPRVQVAEDHRQTSETDASLRSSEAALWSLMGCLTLWLLWTAGRANRQPAPISKSWQPVPPMTDTPLPAPVYDLEEEAAVAIESSQARSQSIPASLVQPGATAVETAGVVFGRPLPPINLATISFAPRRPPQPPT